MALYLNDEAVADLLPMAQAVGCVDAAFRSLTRGLVESGQWIEAPAAFTSREGGLPDGRLAGLAGAA
ncbi:hypothetical protein ACFO0J_10165 [Castellaniella hirudinis]|uniref:Uncharacterized protein n=1 Tax=Castellaniella hirudinis TaxID=1144617 RepID=A0ABV8RZ20_9BURK